MSIRKYYQTGAGLAEILIAMVVVGVGLFALMQLQHRMTSGVSLSKARVEAMELAQKKSEELRAYIEKGQYDFFFTHTRTDWNTPATADEQTEGVNATFGEKWWIRDAPDDDADGTADGNYKQLLVRVDWIDEADDPQHILLNNLIVFSDPALAVLLKNQQEGTEPPSILARRARWGDERAEDGTEDDERVPENGKLVPGLPANNEVFKDTNRKGNWELFVLDALNNPVVVLTSFGGIIHQLRGIIHFEEAHIKATDLAQMTAIATSPAYCEFPLCKSTNCEDELRTTSPPVTRAVEYICFVPGDCSSETIGSITAEGSPSVDCQYGLNEEGAVEKLTGEELSHHLNEIRKLDLAGGWYGKVGLFGVPLNPFDDIITGDSCGDPARNYVSHRLCASGTACTGLTVPPSPCTGTGYITHTEGSGGNEVEYIDGYCKNDVPYAIYENAGVNGSFSNNHFWLIDNDLNDKSCEDILTRFAFSVDNDPTNDATETPVPPPYLASHRIVRPLVVGTTPDNDGNGEPDTIVVAPNDMGLDDRLPPPD